MALEQTLSIALKDNVNQNGRMSYVHERSLLEALANFFGFTTTNANSLQTFAQKWSNAKVTGVSTTNTNRYTLPAGWLDGAVIDEGFDTCDQKAIVSLRDSTTGGRHQITLPAPKSSNFEKKTEKGYRIKQTVGDSMASEIGAIVGRTLIFESGWLIGKK